MTARLPIPGSDDNTWGDILNSYLSQSLNADGTLKTSAVSASGAEQAANKGVAGGYAQLDGSTKIPIALLPATALSSDSDVNITSPINNQVLTYNTGSGKWINQTSPAGVVLDNNAADIQPLGTQAAGSTGKAADASHVHAMPTLNQINHPTSSVDLNSQKITNLANGTAAADAAAFGQIPAALPPSGSAGGDLTGTYPNPTVTSTANFKTQVETVRLDQMAVPTSAVSLNTQKITNLTNGSGAQDAAAFGQIPAALPPNGSAGGDLTGTYPNPTLTGTANVESIISANSTVAGAEQTANKTTDGTLAANSDTLYPSEKAVKTYADTKAPTTAVLTSNVGPISSQTAMQNITGLGLTIGASATEIWRVTYWLLVSAANATMDVKFDFTVPSGCTIAGGGMPGNTANVIGWGTASPGATVLAVGGASTVIAAGTLSGTTGIELVYIVFGGGTGGTVQVRYAQTTSDPGNLSILKGSIMEAVKVAS